MLLRENSDPGPDLREKDAALALGVAAAFIRVVFWHNPFGDWLERRPQRLLRDWAVGLDAASRTSGIALTEVKQVRCAPGWPHVATGFPEVK